MDFPEISLGEHVASARQNLNKELENKKFIYLDTMFLIYFRDFELGRNQRLPKNFSRFHQALKKGIEDETIICPISEHLVAEVLRQSDDQTRAQTLQVLGGLSQNIGFLSSDEVQLLELSRLLSRNHNSPPDKYEKVSPWTKAFDCFGVLYPERGSNFLDEKTRNALQKATFDRMWEMSLVEFFGSTPPSLEDEKPFFENLASKISAENKAHSHEMKSFVGVFNDECCGMVDVLSDVFDLAVESVPVGIANVLRDLKRADLETYDKTKMNIVCAGLLDDHGHERIPSAYVVASLHASRRWNKEQMVKVGDFIDYEHAAAALPYCDALFTEKSLATSIKQKHLRLDEKFKCFVAANVDEAIAYLEKIGS
jgi:hypothetical protein